MTKQQILDTIKTAESNAWLALAKYDLENKPIVTTWMQERQYIENDIGHAKILNEWHALKTLMNQLKIESDVGDANHIEACEIAHTIWKREQNAKGIYYDERGNRIA